MSCDSATQTEQSSIEEDKVQQHDPGLEIDDINHSNNESYSSCDNEESMIDQVSVTPNDTHFEMFIREKIENFKSANHIYPLISSTMRMSVNAKKIEKIVLDPKSEKETLIAGTEGFHFMYDVETEEITNWQSTFDNFALTFQFNFWSPVADPKYDYHIKKFSDRIADCLNALQREIIRQ